MTREMSHSVIDRLRVMGCRATIEVRHDEVGEAHRLVSLARRRLAHLERCWSRFEAMSDVSALNRAEGRSVVVDPSTVDLICAMKVASSMTDGSCQPAHRSGPGVDLSAIERIVVDHHRREVRMMHGLRLDAGSIGKGLAADLVTAQVMRAGAIGVLVEIGGDLRVAGDGEHHGFWCIDVDDPFGDSERHGRMWIRSSGVATSGLEVTKEMGGPENVSVDPLTRMPLRASADRVVSATVIAGSAFEAEAWSTALLARGDGDLEVIRRRGYVARVVMGDGCTIATQEWESNFVAEVMANV